MTTGRRMKKEVLALLESDDFHRGLKAICSLPPRQAVNPLFSFFLSLDERVRWRAVTAMGAVVSRLADADMESARVVVRRLMWSLNDESGGIGWGAPEAMGEIVASHKRLAQEYAPVLISYICEEGNYLEYEMLQRGALWGVGRAAQARPDLMKDALPHLVPFLNAPDPVLRGLAARAIGFLDGQGVRERLEGLLNDGSEMVVYEDGALRDCRVKDLAREAFTAGRSK